MFQKLFGLFGPLLVVNYAYANEFLRTEEEVRGLSLKGQVEQDNVMTDENINDAVKECTTSAPKGKEKKCKHGKMAVWDTDQVTDMSKLFMGKEKFNADLSKWVTGKVTDMSYMFDGCHMFNSDLSHFKYNWRTTSVTNMAHMFKDAWNFNGDISGWNTKNVKDMRAMFKKAMSFNVDVSNWNVKKVTDMDSMFQNAESFSKPALAKWDTKRLVSMDAIFRGSGVGTLGNVRNLIYNWKELNLDESKKGENEMIF